MNLSRLLSVLFFASILAACSSKSAVKEVTENPLPVIFDTDMGNDVDDVLALDMLYKYVESGRIDLLAIPTTKKSEYCAGYLDLMNTWYGHDIPIGIEHAAGEALVDLPSATQWTSATDITARKIYYRTAWNSAIRCLDLTKIDFTKLEYRAVPMEQVKEQPIVEIMIH